MRLDLAVRQGRLFHATKNIRDSGASLEHEFRSFLNARLPTPFSVKSGYLFDPMSDCTPQIDCIVVDDRESHELIRSEGGASYVPYPAGRVLIEVKQSASGLARHIAQAAAVRDAVAAMRRKAHRFHREGRVSRPAPLSILVIGDSKGAKLSPFQKARIDGRLPDLTLLLDRALVIARRDTSAEIFAFGGRDGVNRPFALDNLDLRAGDDWGVWTPEGFPGDKGHTLLWFFFALVRELNQPDGGARGAILEFTDQIAIDFPMVLKSDLASATNW